MKDSCMGCKKFLSFLVFFSTVFSINGMHQEEKNLPSLAQRLNYFEGSVACAIAFQQREMDARIEQLDKQAALIIEAHGRPRDTSLQCILY